MNPHDPGYGEWQGHPYTQAFAASVAHDAGNALKVLLGFARNSTDPKVTKAVQLLDTLTDLHKTLTEKAREDETDERDDPASPG